MIRIIKTVFFILLGCYQKQINEAIFYGKKVIQKTLIDESAGVYFDGDRNVEIDRKCGKLGQTVAVG